MLRYALLTSGCLLAIGGGLSALPISAGAATLRPPVIEAGSPDVIDVAVHCGPHAHYVHGHKTHGQYVKGRCVRDHHR